MDVLLQIKQLSIGYGAKVVLRDVSFEAPPTGVIALMGPSGAGKSSLLRAIGRWNDAQPIFWARGKICLEDVELLDFKSVAWIQRQVPMLAQKARLYTGSVLDNVIAETAASDALSRVEREQWAHQTLEPLGLWDEFGAQLDNAVMNLSMGGHKKILLARMLTQEARCILIDEPCQDVSLAEEADLMEVLSRLAKQRLIILVTHNKHQAKQLSDTVCLISGDRLVEFTPTDIFFEQPLTELGQEFLRSGSSWPTREEASAPAAPEPPAEPVLGFPPEFHWVMMGQLGGMQYPGLLGNVDRDLEGLRRLGVRVLMNLTEMPFDAAKLEAFGLQGEHYPIRDMSVPTLTQARRICRRIASLIEQQQPVVLHCKAGLGRTGTLLACALVYRGMDAARAIEAVRTIKPGYIQTDEQLAFVAKFDQHLKGRKGRRRN